ncbi:pentatricopeptide repeat-containing protein At4g02820, mitochondrial [Cynara cardunculus var. scolymus]|uniref:pentatricopeptide repeat-containing protein At4g02820, mitochondrial n=1 Tax=Cynara cardunculus var. scolymus TaxID=59895 RepID=UPI000D624314|nr:pentatricopeptide repeat-containing protein At4g02820, mitochondrial [Cynara cardunculus var. scolymus]
MMIRLARRSLSAVRYLSTSAVAEVSKAPYPAVITSATRKNAGGGRDTLGRRLLSLVYTKRSAVIAIKKWKEEGHLVRKYELNRIVRELRKLKRYKHALEVCEWMTLQHDIKLLEGDYAVHLDLIAKIRGINSAEKFFEDLPDRMKGQPTCTALLHTYVQHKDASKAEALTKKMSECGFLKYPLPFNHMISLYISNGQFQKVPEILHELKMNTSPDIVTYNLWLTACNAQGDTETAEKIFLELKKTKVNPDWVTFSLLTSMYIKNSRFEDALLSLKEMEKMVSRKVRVAYSSVISLYTGLGKKEDVHRIWKKMKSTFHKLNDAEYNCMISSLLKLNDLEEAKKLYTEWESVSSTGDSRIPNLILAAYVNRNEMKMAEDFFTKRIVEKGIVPSYTSWELLTCGYSHMNQMNKALECFKKALGSVKKWDFDEKIVEKVYGMVEEHGNVEGAEELLTVLRNAGHVSTEIYNLLLRTYAKAGKMPIIVAERMKKDNVPLNEETHELIKITSKLCVSDVSTYVS